MKSLPGNRFLIVCTMLSVCTCTVAHAITVDTSPYWIAGSHDGNEHDKDDILATAVAFGILAEAGLQDRVVHWDYNNHLVDNNAGQYDDMIISTEDGADRFGLSATGRFNEDVFFDCQTELNAAISNFVAVSQQLGPNLRLYYCCAGPMEVPWRMLNAVKNNDASKLQYIVCMSHSDWNENHSHAGDMPHQWNDMVADFGDQVRFHRISDQNGCGGDNDFNSPESQWNWLCQSADPDWEWICSRDMKGAFDASDAGMYMYVITGEAAKNKDSHVGGPLTGAGRLGYCATVQDAQWLFEDYVADNDPPTPDPPQILSLEPEERFIVVTATPGTDAQSPPVEYLFEETTGNCNGNGSNWQASNSFTDTGLKRGTTYGYRVKMRDQVGNETVWSNTSQIMTLGTEDDVAAPVPTGFAVSPTALGQHSVSMTALTAADVNGPVEYYFAEISGNPGGSDSGWQLDPNFTDMELQQATLYRYTVQTRDAICNVSTASAAVEVCTRPPLDIIPDNVINMLDLSALTSQWLRSGCWLAALCDGADLDASDKVNEGDFALLAGSWLDELGPLIITNTYTPVDDAYKEDSDYFNNAVLKVESGRRISFLKFDMNDLPGGYAVTAAILELTESGDVGNGTLRFNRGSSNDWTETTLSDANEPVSAEEVASWSGGVTAGQTVSIDAIPLINGNGVYTLIITMDSGGNDIWFGSAEAGDIGPVLSVTVERD